MTRISCSQGRAANATRAWAVEVLGPMPAASLRALEDLGLTDAELARYLGLSMDDLRQVRHALARHAPAGLPHRAPVLPDISGSRMGRS